MNTAKVVRLLFLSIIIQCFSVHSYGHEVIFSRLSISDGLNSNFVNCIWQDKKGFIWLGTEVGLQRYDGNKFIQVYNESKKHTLPALPVNQIIGDKNNHMWLRMGKHIGWYDFKTNTYHATRLPEMSGDNFNLWTNSKGEVLVTVINFGVYVYNAAKNSFEKWKALAAVPDNWGPYSVFEDVKTGRYWVGGVKGLGVYDTKNNKFYHEGYNPLNLPLLKANLSAYALYVFIDSERRHWVIKWPPDAALQILCYNETTGKLLQKQVNPNTPGYYEALKLTEANKLTWIYGLNLLNVTDKGDGDFYSFYTPNDTNYGINFNTIKQLYEDVDHNVWVATDNGLYFGRVIGDQIRHGKLPVKNNDITFVKQLKNGQLVIGTWGKGIFPLSVNKQLALNLDSAFRERMFVVTKNNSMLNTPWDMAEHSVTGHLWFGCQGGLLLDYNPVTKNGIIINDTVFKAATIRQIVEDSNHNLWFGLQSGRVIKRSSDGRFRVILRHHTIIGKMIIDSKGMLWCTSDGKGLVVINPITEKVIKRYRVTDNASTSLFSDHIRDVVQVNDSIYAISFSENLQFLNYKTGKFKTFDVFNGLPQPIVNCLQPDNSGRLWMATTAGIVRYSFKTNTFRAYDQKDGLITTADYKMLMERCVKLTTGELVFAGGNNFVIFNPDALTDKLTPKDVTITDVKLFNDYININAIGTEGLTLKHDENTITIQFASLSYKLRDKLNYYYMLEGAGKDWIKAEQSLTAAYASLPPGHYTFLVKCISPDGVASQHITSFKFYIRPAFWQTWWFMVLLIIAAAIPVYIIYRLRIKRLLAVQNLREKVARDLHDDMGSTLTSINILSEMANLKLAGDNVQVKDYLGRISTNSNQMMEAMDDIVWSINPANDSMPRIIARMREYAATVLEPRDIDYTVVNDDKLATVKLDMEVKRSLFLIFKEALNNLVKYSQATHVKIEFMVSQSMLQLCITDDGIGFNMQFANQGNGLTNMQNRAKAMRGNLEIKSEKNMGTVVKLKIPIT